MKPRAPITAGLAALALLVSSPALAASAELRGTAGAGVAARDGALFSTIDVGLDASWRGLSASLRAPGQFLVTGDVRRGEAKLLRDRDWDERAEWMRLAPHLGWRHRDRRGHRASLVIAPLAGVTLGHGTVVERYYGALLPDRYKSGARLRIDRGAWGLDAITDDVTAARILAGRGRVRPFASLRRGVARTLTLAATAAVDRQAPLFARHDAAGARRFTAEGELVARRTAITIAGLDLSLQPVRNRTLAVIPYADATFTAIAGRSGFSAHAGLRATLWPDDRRTRIGLRYELRTFDGAALPGFFDTLYEVEQARWLGPGALRTKAEAAIARPAGVITGHLMSATLRVRDAVLTTALQLHPDATGMDTFAAWVHVPWSERLSIRAMAARRRFTGLREVFAPGGWTAAATAMAELVPPFVVYLEVQRAWHVRGGTNPGLHTTLDGAFGLALRTDLGS